MRKIMINRANWRAGHLSDDYNNRCGEGPTQLLNGLGYKCCLGFACDQLSGGIFDLYNKCWPQSLKTLIEPLTIEVSDFFKDTEFSEQAMAINDNQRTTLKEKEQLLTELFLKNNLELEFYGEYPARDN